MKRSRRQAQDGASLVIVLIVISVFGLVLAGLMTESDASLKFTNAVSAHEDKVYAADAGVQFGIQQVRQNSETCAGWTGPGIPGMTVGVRPVAVTCAVMSGSGFGGAGFAVITTSPGVNSLYASNADPKEINGPVYSSGQIAAQGGSGFDVTRGNAYEKAGPDPHNCSVGDGAPSALTVASPAFSYSCTTLARPDPAHEPPAIPSDVDADDYTGTTCRIFRPGRYVDPPALGSNNYFASGVYYFDFDLPTEVFEVQNGMTVIAGRRASYEAAPAITSTCAESDPVGSTGTGALFIFGGTSRLKVLNGGQIEIFGRNDPSSPATPGMSFVAVPADWVSDGWNLNTLPAVAQPSTGLTAGDLLLNVDNGAQRATSIHGLLYAPDQSVRLRATNDSITKVLGGVVVYNIELEAAANVSAFEVSAQPGPPEPQEILITAEAEGLSAGEKSVFSYAVLAVANDSGRTISVKSWRSTGPTD